MARAHQIAAQILTRAHQVTQRLLLLARDPDRVQAVDHQQPQHALGVAPVGLHAILRRPLDLARRRHHATDPRGAQPARQGEPGRPGLIRRARRTRQPGAELDDLARHTRQPPAAHLTRARRRRSPPARYARAHPDRPSCEPVPWSALLCDCGPPRGLQPARLSELPTIAWGTGHTYQPGRTSNLHRVSPACSFSVTRRAAQQDGARTAAPEVPDARRRWIAPAGGPGPSPCGGAGPPPSRASSR